VHPPLGNRSGNGTPDPEVAEELLGDRIEALAAWIQELDAQLRATTVAGDEKTLKELRQALELWSKRDPKFEERLTERVDVLGDRLTTLSSTLNTAAAAHVGADAEIASLRRELEQRAATLERSLRELDSSSQAGSVDELRRTVAELKAERPSKKGDKSVAGLQERLDNFSERLDTLAKTVSTTAAGLAGREGELASLRRTFDETNARIAQLAAGIPKSTDTSGVSELNAQLHALAKQVASGSQALAQREQVTSALATRLEQEASKVEALGAELEERLNELEGKVEGASVGISAKEHELAALHRHLEETRERLDTAVQEVREALPEAVSPADLDTRIAPLDARVDELVARLESTETLATERSVEAARFDELDRRVFEGAGRLAEFERAAATWAEERTQLRAQLEELTALGQAGAKLEAELAPLAARLDALELAVSETAGRTDVDERLEAVSRELGDTTARVEASLDELRQEVASLPQTDVVLETQLAPLTARLDEIEQASGSAAEETLRAQSAWSEERAWVREQLDALVQAVSETAVRADVEEPLAALSARLGELEQELTSAHIDAEAERAKFDARLAELTRPSEPVRPSEDEELKRLLVAFADRIDAIESERATSTETTRGVEDELAHLRSAFEGLEARLATTEQQVEESSANDVAEERIDALRARIDSVEEAAKAPRPAVAPVPGDGRFRVELRALELRMQHAEVAARENREAVLVQLERLAARLEWRLQQLESGQDPESEAPAEQEPLGQVVPLRGGAET
jgi:chromosome segregation ATPase